MTGDTKNGLGNFCQAKRLSSDLLSSSHSLYCLPPLKYRTTAMYCRLVPLSSIRAPPRFPPPAFRVSHKINPNIYSKKKSNDSGSNAAVFTDETKKQSTLVRLVVVTVIFTHSLSLFCCVRHYRASDGFSSIYIVKGIQSIHYETPNEPLRHLRGSGTHGRYQQRPSFGGSQLRRTTGL